ncbi:hypothetical protein BM221_006770 [Beauveria bassiana]|uniref:Oxidoreductase-like domain-containing protein n=1 Tax=Beauveria bassiana TaxID=176275 RepID=A0A2N6NIJ9_BEABA|nr:hypothetical protein BM221_006770 [Beauveria bassiana]
MTTTTTLPPTNRTSKPDWPQRQPRGEYYDILLRDPTPYDTTTTATTTTTTAKASQPLGSSSAPSPPPAKTYDTISSRTAYSNSNDTDTATTAAERARVIFGSRLLGPAERADRAAGRAAQATTIAGVRVPPRPEEPDNCCMSGCVNCVWDLYREDMEEWTLASSKARKRLAESAAAAATAATAATAAATASASAGGAAGAGLGGGGGGSEKNRATGAVGDATIAKDMWTDDVFQNVPVGIREFMKQEKRLKEKHRREGTAGG